MWVPYQSTITIVCRKPHPLTMLTCTRHTLCVCMFPIHCETKFWLLCCYYSYTGTIFGHTGVNTSGMWRTVASYINWAFQQYPEWDTIGMLSLCRMLLNCRQLMPWLLHTQTWCKYSIALVVTTVGPCPRILHWFILSFQRLHHDCEIEVNVLNMLRNNYTWQKKDENINTCTSCQVIA